MRNAFACCLVAVVVAGAGCGEATPAPAPCAGAVPTKGPWSMRATESGASVLWETATPGCVELGLTPEAGGAERIVTAMQQTTVVTGSYGVNSVPRPDVAGTYYVNRADITGLDAGACYRYRVRASDGSEAAGRVCTARPSGQPFTFFAIGDTNPRLLHTTQLFPYTVAHDPDFTVHMGDIQYYSSTESWAYWFWAMEPMLAAGAFFPAIGNHESEKEYVGGDEFTDFYDRLFHQPSLDGTPEWYRFEWGGVWFHTIDTEAPYDSASPQYAWLAASLAEVKTKPGFRFSVVYMHRNLYTLGDTAIVDQRKVLGPLFEASKVRLVLSGHMHGYERFEVGDVTYVTTAGGGGTIGDVNLNVATYPDDVPYRKAASPAYHGMMIDVTPHGAATTLHLRAIGCAKDDCAGPATYGTILDEVTHEIP